MKTFDLSDGGEYRDESFSLWVRRVALAPGEPYGITGRHGDEAMYVEAGALRFGDRELEPGCVAVIEADADATLVAGAVGATVIHVGPTDLVQPADGAYGPTQAGERNVHLIGPRGMLAIEQPGRSTRFFADSACDTCRITLFSTARAEEYRSSSHSHSEDEILFVLDGSIRIGTTVLGPGMGAAIPAHEVYGFRSDDGFRFLNYRRDVSTYRSAANKIEALERPRAMPEVVETGDRR